MNTSTRRYFAIVPAAGSGSRVGADLPKQYLPIGDRLVLQWSVAPLAGCRWIDRVLVVVAPDDVRAAPLFAGQPRVEVLPVGGATRRDTVFNALSCLPGARPEDWVLVHDAARPGLDAPSLARLRDELSDGPAGGLLAWPVSDTVKRADDQGRVAVTLARDGLWLAQTPQMFPRQALAEALGAHPRVTDEAGAMEAAGHPVRLVRGSPTNFKVTTADDLALMRRLLTDEDRP